ncbi:PASTA domain-containing protein [Psychroflexus maritimus]|uniref:PASTA domain-containing protein n=1 Tax=Psychroflexus maritimus TaxID=2714865 RepID=UPI00293B8D9B|nr:PASTA domain-containing protein [Psychroflexus maritimus]
MQLILALIAMVLLVFLGLQWLKVSTNHQDYIEVPNLKKFDLDIVDKKLKEMDLRYEVLDSASYNPDFPPYSVIDHIPKVGTKVKKQRKIYLTLNPGDYAKVQIPDLFINRTLRQVEPSLKSMGLKVGEIIETPYFAKGIVLHLLHEEDTISPGDYITKNSVIDILVSDGSLDFNEKVVPEIKENLNEDLNKTLQNLEDTETN